MRWRRGRRSRNLEDRRAAGSRGFPTIRVRGLPGLRGGRTPRLSCGGVVLLLVLAFLFRGDLLQMLSQVDPGGTTPGAGGAFPPYAAPAPDGPIGDPAEEELVDFVSFVLDDTQATWSELFAASDRRYPEARLVVFRDAYPSACGLGRAATGPFYCPADSKVYIDLSFFDHLRRRMGARGDFAQAYVLAHEIGHHVQNVLGIEREIRRLQRTDPGEANRLSVSMELQADCFAGVWAASTRERGLLETGDIEEALTAAAAVGDDRIQREATGAVRPESFTHGTSRERMEWFRRGLESGDPTACDTSGR